MPGRTKTINQYLTAGLVDQLDLHVVPIILGGGARLFDGVSPEVRLELARVIDAPGRDPHPIPREPGGDMTLLRMDNVLLVVKNLEGAIAFFTELGMTLEGRMVVEGPWVDRTIGIDDARSEIAVMRTPDGHGRIELDRFLAPEAIVPDPGPATVNVLGYRRVMFAVDDIDAVVERLQRHGGELVDEIVQYEDAYRLCYMRGPDDILIGLAQPLG